MNKWQATFLGFKHLPCELSGFEIEALFTFTLADRQMIEGRRRPAPKLALAAADRLSAHEPSAARFGPHRAVRAVAEFG